MFINCEDILKPDPAMVGKHTFQSGSEAAHHLQLHYLVDTLAFCQVKIKLLHTCGSLDLHGEPCLQAMWNLARSLWSYTKLMEETLGVRNGPTGHQGTG